MAEVMKDTVRGSWARRLGNPSWSGVVDHVDHARPLGAHSPARHVDAKIPVSRDDAPRVAAEVPPWLVDRTAWLAMRDAELGAPPPSSAVGGHSTGTGGDHRAATSPVDTAAPAQLEFAHRSSGGHRPADLKGAGGAAHGGLLARGAMPWANPSGFPLGQDYEVQTTQRAMPHGRMRGALRALGFVGVETGSTPSPSPGGATSPFDPTAPRAGFGPDRVTTRHVLRPMGDVPGDPPPVGRPIVGPGWLR